MKKVILSVLVAGSLLATSCKKEAKKVEGEVKAGTEKVVEGAKKAGSEVVEGAEKAVNTATEAGKSVVEAGKDLVNKAGEAVTSAIEGVTIPEFKDAKVTEYVKTYSDYAKKYIDAKGDVVKNASLAKEGVKLAEQGKELLKNMDAETTKKFNSVMNAIKSKMAPAK